MLLDLHTDFSGGRSGDLVFPSFSVFSSLLWPSESKSSAQSVKQKYMFFWNSVAFSMIQWMLAIWSLLPHHFLNPAWTSGSSWFTYYWSLAWENFKHYFASMWDEYNCAVVWAFFGIAFLWDWNENWPCPVLWPLSDIQDLLKLNSSPSFHH